MSGFHRVFEALAGLFAVATLPVGISAYMAGGPQEALWVFVVGWLFLVPVCGVLAGSLSDPVEEIERAREIRDSIADIGTEGATDDEKEDPLDALRRRYANGEIDERELERGLETLLETEDARAEDTDAIRNSLGRLEEPDTTETRQSADSDSRETALDLE